MTKPEPVARLLRMLFGPLVWAAHFLLVYAAESVFCRLLDGPGHSIFVITATAIALAMVLLRSSAAMRLKPAASSDHEGFLLRVEMSLSALAGLGILYVGTVGALLPACR
ncbi:hypothetical protein ASE63_12650 [Bosea sp. Root381]|uniref:hypothetical protein n=1 Tax=Bosea sp. Root381 TaxID=1736524 RepID=UPI0006F2D59A|nr:hypothetical protein [Bosea sp. Root381]KRD95858.1 hypothetical protein ASE63_12650 [Bosea sp. Root381]